MSAYKLTNIILALFWSFLGLAIIFRGIGTIIAFGSDMKQLSIWLIVFFVLGLAKGIFVIGKYFRKNINLLDNMQNTVVNYMFGWVKVFNFRNLLIMLLMMTLGITCAVLFEKLDWLLALGLLRITVGTALMSSSMPYWQQVK